MYDALVIFLPVNAETTKTASLLGALLCVLGKQCQFARVNTTHISLINVCVSLYGVSLLLCTSVEHVHYGEHYNTYTM